MAGSAVEGLQVFRTVDGVSVLTPLSEWWHLGLANRLLFV